MINSSKKYQKLFRKLFPFGTITLVTAIFFWKFFIKGLIPIPGDFITGVYYPWLDYKWGYSVGVPVKNPITADVVSLIYPEQMLSVDLMKSGIWPLWNPYILAGTPLLANLQSAPFSPTNIIYIFFEKITAWGLQIYFQHFFSILFMFLLLRYWKLKVLPSLFGGIVFSFSGFNMIFSQWNGHALASSFIPLTLLFLDKWMEKRKIIYGLGISLAFTAQLLSGYPQTSLYTAIILFTFFIFRFLYKKNLKEGLKNAIYLLPFAILTLGLGAIQLFPSAELWKLSQRAYEPNLFDWTFLPWIKTIIFIAPDFFGNHATYNYWGPQDYTSNTAYIGVIAAFLVFTAFTVKKKDAALKILLISLIISIFLSFKTPISLFLWKHNILGMNAASAHRATIIMTFCFSAISSFGLNYIVNEPSKIKLKLLIPLYSLIFIYGLWSLSKYQYNENAMISVPIIGEVNKYLVGLKNLIPPFVILLFLSMLLILNKIRILPKIFLINLLTLLMIVELFRFGWKFTPFSDRKLIYPTTPILDFLVNEEKPFRTTGNSVIPDNLRSVYKIESVEGYETIHPLWISQFISAVNSNLSDSTPVGRFGSINDDTARLLDMVNTKYVLTNKYDSKNLPNIDGAIPKKFQNNKYEIVFEDKSVAVLRNTKALPRAFMVYDWMVESSDKKTLEFMLDENFDTTKQIVLENKVSPPNDHNHINSYYSVKYLNYQNQSSSLIVSTDQDGFLFVSDAYYPGWKVFIDGRKENILRANFAFRAVKTPKGTHKVDFIYDPDSFRIGKITTIISLSATALLLFVNIIYEKNGRRVA